MHVRRPTVPPPADADSGEGAGVGGAWPEQLLRVASHGVVWTIVLVPTVIQMADGWRPVRDDALISIGSYRVFSAATPLTGGWSQASQGMPHAFFDLGPLLFWLLSVPVRLDPGQGAIWGAALVCGIALSVAIEAAWSVKGWPACAAVALAVAVVGRQTQIFADLVWNPHFGLVFMMATAVVAWTVASGRFGWWPVTVLFASVAAQSHLLYAIPAVALVVLAPVVAWVGRDRPRRWRWAVVGLGVGVACWVLPLVQQFTGHPGNLSLILHAGPHRARIGLAFGLHSLSTAVAPRPVWLSPFPFLSVPHDLETHAVAWAYVSVGLVAAVAAGAWVMRRPPLFALAALGLVLDAATVASFAALPKDDIIVVSYLAPYLWALGALIWVIVLWALAEVVAVAGAVAYRRLRSERRGRRLLVSMAQLAAVGLLVFAGLEGTRTLASSAHGRIAAISFDRPLDDAVARAVERTLAPGPVVVEVRPATFGPAHGDYAVDYWGLAFVLLAAGWHPGLTSGFFGVATHLTVPPHSHWPEATVGVDPSDKAVTGVTRTTFGRRRQSRPKPGVK
jgi:hypothetical protein